MLETVVAGAVAGYAIAVPVGAIAVLIIQIGLTRGLRAGVAAAAGAATADGIYATIAVLAGIGVTALIGPLVTPLRIVGGAVLIGLGGRGLLTLRGGRALGDGGVDMKIGGDRAHRRTYLELLALTLLNPATVIYFAALTVGLPILEAAPLAERVVFAVSAFASSLSWQVVLALFGAALGRGTGRALRTPTVLVGNGVVIALGAVILLEGLRAMVSGG